MTDNILDEHEDDDVKAARAIYDQIIADHGSDDPGDTFATTTAMIAVMAAKCLAHACIDKGSTEGEALAVEIGSFIQMFAQAVADMAIAEIGIHRAKKVAANDQGAV